MSVNLNYDTSSLRSGSQVQSLIASVHPVNGIAFVVCIVLMIGPIWASTQENQTLLHVRAVPKIKQLNLLNQCVVVLEQGTLILA